MLQDPSQHHKKLLGKVESVVRSESWRYVKYREKPSKSGLDKENQF